MLTLQLPQRPLMMRELVEATAAATVPDLHMKVSHAEAWVHPDHISLRERAQKVHLVALVDMVLRGEITARSALYRTEYPKFSISDVDKCMVTFEDAQTFCQSLGIDLQLEASLSAESVAEPQQMEWVLHKPKKDDILAGVIYRTIAPLRRAGSRRPTARKVFDIWGTNKPAEFLSVTAAEVSYVDANDDTTTKSFTQVEDRVKRMTGAKKKR